MSSNDLRRLLDYPDGDRRLPTLPAIATRARRRQNRRRAAVLITTLAVVAVTVAAVVWPIDLTGRRESVPVSPDPSRVTRVEFGEIHRVGHGWEVRMDGMTSQVCFRNRVAVSGINGPWGSTHSMCRRFLSWPKAPLRLLVNRSHSRVLVQGLVPYDSRRIQVVTRDKAYPADVVHFANTKLWSYYSRWLPAGADDPGLAVVVYDRRGRPHSFGEKHRATVTNLVAR